MILTKGTTWISETARSVLLHGIEGISIKELVDVLENNYKSRDACWAAISRLTKKLNDQGFIELQGEKRARFLITTVKGKSQIGRDIILKLPIQTRLKDGAKRILKTGVRDKLEDLILELLAKRGELTIRDIANYLNVQDSIVSSEVQHLSEKEILTKDIKKIKQVEVPFYHLNWRKALGPLSKIIPKHVPEEKTND